jgi:hypothetical protein
MTGKATGGQNEKNPKAEFPRRETTTEHKSDADDIKILPVSATELQPEGKTTLMRYYAKM